MSVTIPAREAVRVAPAVDASVWPWAALALLVPASFMASREAPYLLGAVGFTLFAIPHNITELTFFFAGRGAVGSALPRAPRWALVCMVLMMTPAFVYLLPGAVTPEQKVELFHWHMTAFPLWLGAMALAAPMRAGWRMFGAIAGGVLATLAWNSPFVASVVIANLHHLTALVIAWLILRARPAAEQRLARPLFLGLVAALALGTVWLLVGPQPQMGPEGVSGAGDALASSIYLDGMAPQTLDRWMAVYSFQLWLHYGVWVMLVPALRLLPSPLALRPAPRALVVAALLAAALGGSLLFYQSFAHTRVVYLALAGLHSYGEFPVMFFYARTARDIPGNEVP